MAYALTTPTGSTIRSSISSASSTTTCAAWHACVLATDPAYQGVAEPEVEALLDAALTPDDGTTSAALRRPLYVVVEKILGAREALWETWPVAGTSGYDFLNVLNGLFVAAVEDGHTTLAVAQLLAPCPVALLMAEKA